jgi:hypothetical protein
VSHLLPFLATPFLKRLGSVRPYLSQPITLRIG